MTCYLSSVAGFAGGYLGGHIGFGTIGCDECYARRKKCALISAGVAGISIVAFKYLYGKPLCDETIVKNIVINCIISPLVGAVVAKLARPRLEMLDR